MTTPQNHPAPQEHGATPGLVYHLFARQADGIFRKLTGYAMTHAECCTMKSKFSNWSQARILFVEESPRRWRKLSEEPLTEADLPCWGYYPGRRNDIRLIDFHGDQMTHWMPAADDIPTAPTELS